MTISEFKASLSNTTAPTQSPLLLALWYDGRGEWEKAHEVAQDINTPDGSWIHAYLHRKEGDRSNAQYWYHRANQKMPSYSLEREWEEIASVLLTSLHQ